MRAIFTFCLGLLLCLVTMALLFVVLFPMLAPALYSNHLLSPHMFFQPGGDQLSILIGMFLCLSVLMLFALRSWRLPKVEQVVQPPDDGALRELAAMQERLERRMENVETILVARHPADEFMERLHTGK